MGRAGGRVGAVVMLSSVPVQEVEADKDEHALKQEIRELRGRLERLELVRLGAQGQTPVGREHSPSLTP